MRFICCSKRKGSFVCPSVRCVRVQLIRYTCQLAATDQRDRSKRRSSSSRSSAKQINRAFRPYARQLRRVNWIEFGSSLEERGSPKVEPDAQTTNKIARARLGTRPRSRRPQSRAGIREAAATKRQLLERSSSSSRRRTNKVHYVPRPSPD